jgi:Tol biopolymer transport system component
LVRYDAQSSRLQPYLGGNSAEFVTFSPDGQVVAYVTFPEGIMWRANRDGSHPVQLTDAPWHPLNPRWSPDGAQILFFQIDWAGHMRSYIVPSQGGTPRPLLPEDNEGQGDPNWSPDGHKIVFSTLETPGESSGVFNLRVLDLASHQITTLPGSEGVWSPRWSPNGRFIAGLNGGAGMKIFDFETQRWSEVQRMGACSFPTWSSDSQFIYFLLPRMIRACLESAYRAAMRSALSI